MDKFHNYKCQTCDNIIRCCKDQETGFTDRNGNMIHVGDYIRSGSAFGEVFIHKGDYCVDVWGLKRFIAEGDCEIVDA